MRARDFVKEAKKHISPSGVETTMDPEDDDYDVNYGPDGGVAKFRRSQGLDVRTGSKKIKDQGVSEGTEATRRQVNLKKKIDKGTATPEQKKEYEALKAKNTGLKPGVAEGFMDTLKGAAKELTRDSLQKKIKQAWENTFWPKHIEPALNRIQIDGQPFRRMVLGEPRVIENDRSKNAILKQYTVNIVFPIDPEQWAGDEIRYLEAQLRNIEDGEWNPKVHGLGLVSFDQPMKSFQYTKGPVPDLVIPVRITSLDINRSLVGEQGIQEGSDETNDEYDADYYTDPKSQITDGTNDYYADYYTDLLSQTRNMSWTDRATTRDRVRRDLASGRIDLGTLKTEIRRLNSEVKKKT